jgi:hypothetical protein
MTLTWELLIDWDNDGTLESDESDRVIGIRTDRGRDRMLGDRGPQNMKIGRATIDLDNKNNRYDPFNSNSPLYPNIKPRREAQLQVSSGGTLYGVFRGFIRNPSTRKYADPKAQLVIEDGWRLLQDQEVSRAVEEDIGEGEAIEKILTAAGWPTKNWAWGVTGQAEWGVNTRWADPNQIRSWGLDIGTSSDVIPYWWAEGSAITEINNLIKATFGLVWIGTGGKFYFRGRNQLIGQSVDVTITQDEILKDFDIGQPSENIKNTIEINAYPITINQNVTLWNLRDKIFVASGDTETVTATFQYAAIVIDTPAANTDYTANTSEDGSGDDITSDISVSLTRYGKSARIEITNNGSQSGYITSMRLQGDELDNSESISVLAENSTSQNDYGTQSLTIDVPWIQEFQVAKSYSLWLKSWLADPTTRPAVTIEYRPSLQFGHDLGTKVRLKLDKIGLDTEFIVANIEHQSITKNCQAIRTTWTLEPVDRQAYWKWGLTGFSEWGESTIWAFGSQ